MIYVFESIARLAIFNGLIFKFHQVKSEYL